MPNGISGLGSNIAKVALVTAASWCVEKGIEYCFDRARQRLAANSASSTSIDPAAGDLPIDEHSILAINYTNQVSINEPLNISEELSKSREKRQAAGNAEGTSASSASLSDFGDDEIKYCLSVLTENEFVQLLVACGMQTQAELIPLLPGTVKRGVIRHFSSYPRGTTKLSNVELHHLKQALSAICTNIGADVLNIVRERDPTLNRDYPLKHIVREVEKGLNDGVLPLSSTSNTNLQAANSFLALATASLTDASPTERPPAPSAAASTITSPATSATSSSPTGMQEALLFQVLIICIAFCQDFLWRCSTTIFEANVDDGEDEIFDELSLMMAEFEQIIERKLRITTAKCGGWNKLSSSSLPYSAIAGGVLGGVLLALQGFRTLRGGVV